MTDARPAGFELGARVAGDDAVELGMSQRTQGVRVPGSTRSLLPTCGPSMTVARATGDWARMRAANAV